jgi:hypothetical protein
MASPLTVLAASTNNRCEYNNFPTGTYAEAADGVKNQAGSNTTLWVGQIFDGTYYYVSESAMEFDTSSIPDDATITAATFSLVVASGGNNPATAHVQEVYAYDWGATFSYTDWRTRSHLSALTLLASRSCSGFNESTSAYNAFTSTAAFLSAINKTGNTKLIMCTDRHRAGTVPTNGERMKWEPTATAGKQPKLVVTYTEASSTPINLLRPHIIPSLGGQ